MIPTVTLAEVSLPTIELAAASLPFYSVASQWGQSSGVVDGDDLISCFPYVLDMILV